jgi:hypothetical protein
VSSSVAPDLSSLKSMAHADVTHEQFGHWSARSRAARHWSALERGFLPPLLEIQESPPSPVHRWVLWNIIGFVAALIAWAIIGRISIVATAPRKFVPDGRVKEVQPLESSIVKAIHVKEGQRVHAGDVLLELDPTLTAAELAANVDKYGFNQLELARLAAELSHTYGHVAVRSIGGPLDHLAAARSALWLRANARAAQDPRQSNGHSDLTATATAPVMTISGEPGGIPRCMSARRFSVEVEHLLLPPDEKGIWLLAAFGQNQTPVTPMWLL